MLTRLVPFRLLRVLLAVLIVIAGGLLVLPVSARQADGADLQMNQIAISQYLREYRVRHHLPGLAVAVVRNRTVVHVAGYGQTASRTAVTPSTPMPIASLSKSFTSLATLQKPEAFGGWLMRIVSNLSLNYRRGRKGNGNVGYRPFVAV